MRCVPAGKPTDRLGCTDNLCILWSPAMGTWPRGTNGWNCRPLRPLGAQPMTPHSVEVTRVSYALPHAAHKWWNPQRLNKWGFLFRPVFKNENTPKIIVVFVEEACSNYWRSQTSADRRMAIYLRHCYACRHQKFDRRLVATVMACGSNFLWLFRLLFLMTLKLYRAISVEIHAIFPRYCVLSLQCYLWNTLQ